MVKVAASTLTAALLVSSAIAVPAYYEQNNVERRSEGSVELDARSPLGLGLLFRGAKDVFKVGEHVLEGSSGNNNHQRRSFEEHAAVLTREDLNEIFGREFVNDIEARSPFGLGFLFKGITKVASKVFGGGSSNHRRSFDEPNEVITREDLEEVFGREFVNDIEARSPFGLGFLFKGITKVASKVFGGGSSNHRRSFDETDDIVTREDLNDIFGREFVNDIEARSPFGLGFLFKGVSKVVSKVVGGGGGNNQRRSFDETDEVVTREDLEDIFGREFVNDIEARSPFGLGFLFKGVGKVVSKVFGGGRSQNQRRSFDETEELVTREDLEEFFGREFVNDIEERSPFGLGFLFKGVRKVVGLGAKAIGGGGSNNQRRSLEFDEDIFERGFYDDLD